MGPPLSLGYLPHANPLPQILEAGDVVGGSRSLTPCEDDPAASRLLLLFVVVPAVELVLLIEIGRRIGTLATLGLIVATGALGAYLARRQGLGVLRRMRQETAAGQLPAAPVMDGIMVLIAGALLVTPGVLTDAFGFFCLIPPCRELLKRYLKAWLERAVRRGDVTVSVDLGSGSSASSPRTVRDITPKGGPPAEDGDHRRIGESSQEGRSGKAGPRLARSATSRRRAARRQRTAITGGSASPRKKGDRGRPVKSRAP